MTDEQKAVLKSWVEPKGLTTFEARDLIKKEFGLDYSVKQVHVILSSLGLKHCRPSRNEDYDMGTSRMLWKLRV